MRKLIFLLLLIFAGYVGYNYFFGKGEDKAKAQTVVTETKELAHSIGDFLKRQKEKYDDGEFDRLIERVENTLHRMRTTTEQKGEEGEQGLRELRDELKKVDSLKLSEENRLRLKKVMDDLDARLDKKN